MAFEPQLPGGWFSGSMTSVVSDPNGSIPETNIIQIADPWRVEVKWDITGHLVAALAPNASWKIEVFLESIGPGLEERVGTANENVGVPALNHSYTKTIIVPGNYPGLTPGAYKLATVVTLNNGGVPCPIAGYVEGPVMQFYQFP